MKLKSGYRQTEAGIIPDDWLAETLGPHVEIKSGESPSLFRFNSGKIPYFKVEQLNNHSKYATETCYFVDSLKTIPSGSLIFPKRGASILLNKVRILSVDSFMDTNLMTLTPDTSIDGEFLYYAITHIGLWKVADTTSIPQINNKHITPLVVAIPSSKIEQRAIAESLGDIDSLIESLEQLVLKKRRIKQGALQELLQPKDSWVEKRLGDTGTLKARIGWQGLTTSEYLTSGEFHLVTGTDFKDSSIDWNNCCYVEERRYKQDKNIQLKERDILVTKDGTIGKVALVDHLDKPATLNSGVFVIRPIDEVFVPTFFYYVLCSDLFTTFLGQLSAGSTINHLYQKDFIDFRYKTPRTKSEQTEIGIALRDMDVEIEMLVARLTKTRQLKQGMMQELLTGNIRLPANDSNHKGAKHKALLSKPN